MRNRNTSLFAYTLSHFCVDFGCIFILYRLFPAGGAPEGQWLAFFVYCVIAFGLQAPFGDFLDKRGKEPGALVGFLLIAFGIALCAAVSVLGGSVSLAVIGAGAAGGFGGVPSVFAWTAVCLAALGNALFHVEGGIDSLVNAGGHMSRSGVFVCSGAMGVALGALAGPRAETGAGDGAGVSEALPLLLIAVSAVSVLLFKYRGREFKKSSPPAWFGTDAACGTDAKGRHGFALLLLFAAVIIRAFGGGLIQMPWKPEYILLPAAAACAGKAAGGFLADGFGARRAACIPLLVCIPLFCFGYSVPPLCAAGVFLFNMAMPVTLCAFSDRLRGHPGLAFGTASLALLVGTVPHYFMQMGQGAALAVLPALCAAAAAAIFTVVPGGGKPGLKKEE
ncbi:MAG: hypothetical protein FWG03_04925 [Clostridiales bacterium]|nr:hypothetical protein [Clostridiales bacterium]